MAKRRKKRGAGSPLGFGMKEWLIIGGAGLVAFFIFRPKANAGTYTPAPAPSIPTGGGSTTGGGTGAGTGTGTQTIPVTCNGVPPLYNGFPNFGYALPTGNNKEYFYPLSDTEKNARLTLGAKGIHVLTFQIWLNNNQPKNRLIEVDGVFGNGTLNSFNRQVNQSLKDLYTAGTLTLNKIGAMSNSQFDLVYILRNQKRFSEGFIPYCPQLTEFFFGAYSYKDGRTYNGHGSDI